jgi:hypothetical protein
MYRTDYGLSEMAHLTARKANLSWLMAAHDTLTLQLPGCAALTVPLTE